jgi:hypothetical protein
MSHSAAVKLSILGATGRTPDIDAIVYGCYYTCWEIDAYHYYSEWNESDNRVHGCHRICVDH